MTGISRLTNSWPLIDSEWSESSERKWGVFETWCIAMLDRSVKSVCWMRYWWRVRAGLLQAFSLLLLFLT
jgi:hypothetical protein